MGGLVESLGGVATAAGGGAAGIERLAMLVGERSDATPVVMFVVENDQMLPTAQKLMASFRADGFASEMLATGSPRKRYDKAIKMEPAVVVSLNVINGVEDVGMKALNGEGDRILGAVREGLLASLN